MLSRFWASCLTPLPIIPSIGLRAFFPPGSNLSVRPGKRPMRMEDLPLPVGKDKDDRYEITETV